MPKLVAQPISSQDPAKQVRATWFVPVGENIQLGRSTPSHWTADWDEKISPFHATLHWENGKLHVQRRMTPRPTTNPILFDGETCDEFALLVGQFFDIGDTRFTLTDDSETDLTFTLDQVRSARFVAPREPMEALAELPKLIRLGANDKQLTEKVTLVLREGMKHAATAAVGRIVVDLAFTDEPLRPEFLHARGTTGVLSPDTVFWSESLIRDAVRLRECKWTMRRLTPPTNDSSASAYTVYEDADWAMCVPLLEELSPGWFLYLMGRTPTQWRQLNSVQRELHKLNDVKFVELVADILGSLRAIHQLRRRQDVLSSFVSEPVLNALAYSQDIESVLKQRRQAVTVLFCDLRESCRAAEDTPLEQLWQQVGRALDMMSKNIVTTNGVIGDFQGDALMGFWGWPKGDPKEQVEHAVQAAHAIRREFLDAQDRPDDPLARFRCGIGIAHGVALAGPMGTFDHAQASVFGQVVNLAARLESMTKEFGVAILLDDATANTLLERDASWNAQLRELATVRPYGMTQTAVTAWQLTTSDRRAQENERLADFDGLNYRAALDSFRAGRWTRASELLAQGFLPKYGPAKLLLDFIQQQESPPEKWDGVIDMEQNRTKLPRTPQKKKSRP